jgi:hypothetical protein
MKFKHFCSPFLVAALLCTAGCDPSSGGPQNTSSPPDAPAQPAQASAPTPPPVLDSLLTRRNFYFVFDGSGSMNESRCTGGWSSKLKIAKQAIVDFEGNLKPEDNLALFVFDHAGCSERVPLGNGKENRAEFETQVQAVSADNGTPLYEAIQSGFEKLEEQRKKQLGYGEYHIVVVTDGEANGIPENGLIDRINKTPIIVHTIGFCLGEGHSLNQPGKTYYVDAKNSEEIKKGLRDVLAESEKFDK